ncbi:hypothetical protein TELCIR_05040 [Teladorsagia circumcincta]|uniref:Protein kinase domain-containing protein n=1 Tax=Teladorsagia circumcincta TaxID=45464 RepID=A0A2G9US74_TELCI|nr:hypothetical protein TELCIR_05040 [Teladorsagia circumcincta]
MNKTKRFKCIRLRVRVPLRARLEDRGDSHLIVISGWPVAPINLTIGWSGETETQILSDDKAVTFFNNLVVRPDKGYGAFGEVYCGSWEKTGERTVAIKSMKADEDVEKEALVLSRLEHPNVVRLYGMTRDGPCLLLVFEHMNLGDLRSYLRARAPTSSSYSQFPPALIENELRLIVRQIVSGLCYLTSQQIVHRDLAARNCLVSGETDLRCCLPSQRPPITVKARTAQITIT